MKRPFSCVKDFFRHPSFKMLIPAFLFIVVVMLSIRTTWYMPRYFLDGDSSSELVLAQHLNETGRLLSTDWYYSTELRVLNTQLIYAPLFSLFSDWHMVRFVGALIMQAILILSFGYICKQITLSVGAFFLGASLLILPTSVGYGRIVLYHTYYMPHIILGFLIIALFISILNHSAKKQRLQTSIRLFLLIILSFVSGLGGIRQGIITHVPLLFTLLIFYIHSCHGQSVFSVSKARLIHIAIAILAAASFALGYLINSLVLSKVFSFADYTTLASAFASMDDLQSILEGLLQAFGFRLDIPIMSLLGMLSIGGIFSCVYCIRGTHTFVHSTDASMSHFHKLIGAIPFSSLFVICFIFVFSEGSWYYPLYLLPVTVWFIPMLSMMYDKIPNKLREFRWNHIGLILSVLFLVLNGFVNAEYFASGGERFAQKYEGLTFQDHAWKKKLKNPLSVLQEHGYTQGYVHFWACNALTEMTNGKIRCVPILADPQSNSLYIYKWLTLDSTINADADKVFLILTPAQEWHYKRTPLADHGKLLYPSDGDFVVYGFDDPSIIKDFLHQ